MAALSSGRDGTPRRPLPKLVPIEPAPASSDETPRTGRSEDSARQRRRANQRLIRDSPPEMDEPTNRRAKKDTSLPPRADPTDERPISKRRKARRRVQSSTQVSGQPSLLNGFEEEVIVESSKKSRDDGLTDPLAATFTAATPSKSAPTPRIYFEDKKTFSSVNQQAATTRLAMQINGSPSTIGGNQTYTFQQQAAETLKRYTIQVAKQTHAAFQRLFIFIHGINSGYALWVCIFAYVFTQTNVEVFFQTYRNIALITHLLFYLFLALCMVDVLDRIDPVKFNKTVFLECISVQNAAVALIFYAIAMIVNLVMMGTEDAFRMTLFNETLCDNRNITTIIDSDNNQWKQLTAVRAAFILAGWFIVSIHVKKDRLRTMIKNTEEKAFYEELNIEPTSVPLPTRMNGP